MSQEQRKPWPKSLVLLSKKCRSGPLRSVLHLQGWQWSSQDFVTPTINSIRDINICILLLVNLLLWFYNIPWWPVLAADSYTESWMNVKKKNGQNEKKKWCNCPFRETGTFVGETGTPICCSLRNYFAVLPCPLLKYNTLVTHLLHCAAVVTIFSWRW